MSNVFSCVGTLGADAEFKTVGHNATPVLSFRIANNNYNSKTKQNEPLWVRCQLWGSRAEGNLKDYLKKGQQVFVSGTLTLNEYQANDGTTKTSLELNCNVVDLVGKKDNAAPSNKPPINGTATHEPPQFDDDIPF